MPLMLMKFFNVSALGLVLAFQGQNLTGLGPLCEMAQHKVAFAAQVPVEPPPSNPERREREVPNGHWCQRPPLPRSEKAHACACHQHDCAKRADDDNSYSAHTDPECQDYCHINKCLCAKQDCP
jgi:hypothetical protein